LNKLKVIILRYKNLNLNISAEKRSIVNEKVLNVILSNNTEFTREQIFNLYTGDGGLSGLNFNDFDNFHKYSEAKREKEAGQFLTPFSTCKEIIEALQIERSNAVADLTCGTGNFFNFLPEGIKIFGN
jgi:type I restriction-modification system DNA methylase subunit